MKKTIPNEWSMSDFRETTKYMDSIYNLFAKMSGLSDAEFWSMTMIREGFTAQTEISEQLYLSKQTVNSAFKNLVKKGFVRLETLENNQRRKQALLTEAGIEFAEQHIDNMHNLEEHTWKSLSREEQKTLIQLTRKYCTLLHEELKKYEEETS